MPAPSFASGQARYSRAAFRRYLNDLSAQISPSSVEGFIGEDAMKLLHSDRESFSQAEAWMIFRAAYEKRLFDIVERNGAPPVSFDIQAPFNIQDSPIGFDQDVPATPLINRKTKIGGFPVDFPLGLPASVLASNAKWIEFYARRGFDILTYKTVRSRPRAAHPWPNWVFLIDPAEMATSSKYSFHGDPSYFPEDLARVSMANSFGIPSNEPLWWQDDVRLARKCVREGHQVLIVSVVASENSSEDALIEDFVRTALLAKAAGADIIEANYSCPNTLTDLAKEVYKSERISARISSAMKEALDGTPLFVKIGYLSKTELHRFVESNAPFIDGVVAINTIAAEVLDKEGKPIFPLDGRRLAGISGWAIRARAQEVARNLVDLRRYLGKNFTILGLGGALTKQDCFDYLNIGVDGVETCTGAFLNPFIGLETRFDKEAFANRPSQLRFGANVVGKILEEVFFHPRRNSTITFDTENRAITIKRT
jgi:dihydroorotate dehydrogenase